MAVNSRFPVGVHVVTLLAHDAPSPCTSEYVAGSVNTNPVVVRRLLGRLADAGLTESRMGPGGGWTLRRSPEQITLLDVYRATADTGLVAGVPSPPNPQCPVGRSIQPVLTERISVAERRFHDELAATSIADLLAAVRARH